MKISFLNRNLGASSMNRRPTWCIISLICLLAGGYLVGSYVGLLVCLLMGVAGILIAVVVRARLNSNNYDRVETAPNWKDGPQVTAGWDYRPRGAIRRRVDVDLPAETANGPSSRLSAVNENVWFNALDCSAVAPEAIVENATEKAPLSDCADVVSVYDQSPIDEQTVVAEDGRGKTEIKFARS
jgi:hypothetical protein